MRLEVSKIRGVFLVHNASLVSENKANDMLWRDCDLDHLENQEIQSDAHSMNSKTDLKFVHRQTVYFLQMLEPLQRCDCLSPFRTTVRSHSAPMEMRASP